LQITVDSPASIYGCTANFKSGTYIINAEGCDKFIIHLHFVGEQRWPLHPCKGLVLALGVVACVIVLVFVCLILFALCLLFVCSLFALYLLSFFSLLLLFVFAFVCFFSSFVYLLFVCFCFAFLFFAFLFVLFSFIYGLFILCLSGVLFHARKRCVYVYMRVCMLCVWCVRVSTFLGSKDVVRWPRARSRRGVCVTVFYCCFCV